MLCKSGLGNNDLTMLRPLDVVGGASNLLDAAAPANGGGSKMSAATRVAKPMMKERSKTHGCG
jgi:hypothetical protein